MRACVEKKPLIGHNIDQSVCDRRVMNKSGDLVNNSTYLEWRSS